MAELESKVKEIIAEQLGQDLENVVENASFAEDLGADSLDTVEMVMSLEEEFDIEVPEDDAAKLKTVSDAIEYIKSKAE